MPLREQSLSTDIEDKIGTEEHNDKSDSRKQNHEPEVPVVGLGRIAGRR